jgi:hypothetical protein
MYVYMVCHDDYGHEDWKYFKNEKDADDYREEIDPDGDNSDVVSIYVS